MVEPSFRTAIFGTCDWGRVFVCFFLVIVARLMKTLVLGAGGLSQNLGVSLYFLGVYYYCLPGNHINKTYPPGTNHISHQTGSSENLDSKLPWDMLVPGRVQGGPQPGYNSSYQLIFRRPGSFIYNWFLGPILFPNGRKWG